MINSYKIGTLIAILFLALNITTASAGTMSTSSNRGLETGGGNEVLTLEQIRALIREADEVFNTIEAGYFCAQGDEELERYKEALKKYEAAARSFKLAIEVSNTIINSPNATETDIKDAKAAKAESEKGLIPLEAKIKRLKAQIKACEDNPIDDAV